MRAWAVAAALGLVLGGCSWLVVDAPPRPATAADASRCDRESAAPGFDMTVFSVILLSDMLVAALAAAADELDERDEVIAAGAAAGVGGAFGLSGVYGMHHVARCKRLNGDLDDEDEEEEEEDGEWRR